jgi:hypothetical protein
MADVSNTSVDLPGQAPGMVTEQDRAIVARREAGAS